MIKIIINKDGTVRHENERGVLHNLKGPALEHGDIGWYYINGSLYSKLDWERHPLRQESLIHENIKNNIKILLNKI